MVVGAYYAQSRAARSGKVYGSAMVCDCTAHTVVCADLSAGLPATRGTTID